jgi:transcriptional regulator with XRE-family HTH domain
MFDAKSALHDNSHQIHICRTDERLTLQMLAQRSGVAASTIHKIEAQQMVPTISVLFKIARGLSGDGLPNSSVTNTNIERARRVRVRPFHTSSKRPSRNRMLGSGISNWPP